MIEYYAKIAIYHGHYHDYESEDDIILDATFKKYFTVFHKFIGYLYSYFMHATRFSLFVTVCLCVCVCVSDCMTLKQQNMNGKQ